MSDQAKPEAKQTLRAIPQSVFLELQRQRALRESTAPTPELSQPKR